MGESVDLNCWTDGRIIAGRSRAVTATFVVKSQRHDSRIIAPIRA